MKKKRLLAVLCSAMLVVQGIIPATAGELTLYEETDADINVDAAREEVEADAVALDEGEILSEDNKEDTEYVPQDDVLIEGEEAPAPESIEELPGLDGSLEVEEGYVLPADSFGEELVPEDAPGAEEAELELVEDVITGETDDAPEEVPAEAGEDFPEVLDEDAANIGDPALAGAADASGTCGENLSWTLSGGTLTITGTGDMKNYSQGRAPWDAYTDQITAVSIGTGVTSIGNFAFYYCRNLPKIDIPDSVTSIGSSAFQKCDALKDVNMGDGVTWIDSYAFSGCEKIENVKLSANLKYIYSYAFYQCSGLKDIVFPNTLESIEYCAFQDCTGLTSIVIPKGVTNLGTNAFEGCSGLVSAELPDTMTYLNACLFRNCTSLKDVKLGQNLTGIGYEAFEGCSSLTDITLPDSVITIGFNAFSGCSSLEEINIPVGVTSIDYNAFSDCSSLREISLPYSVTSLGTNAFSNCTGLTSVSLGDRLLSLPNGIFYGCTSLTEIELPYSVTSLGDSTFANCTSLKTVILGNRLQSISSGAFSGCTSLINLEIPDNVTAIDDYAFSFCRSLVEIKIPDNVKSIGQQAFSYCNSLAKINIPNGVETLPNEVFYECGSLTDISLGTGLKSIGISTFSDCRDLPEITIPDAVESIGESAFYNCSSLKDVTLPDSVTEIGSYTFGNCKSLEVVTLSDNLKKLPYLTFSNCTSLESFTIPEGITNLENHVFSECSALQEVTFTGDSPTFNSETFGNANVIVYYPWTNPTWEWARSASMSGVKQFIGLPSALTLNKYEVTLPVLSTEQIEVSDLVEGDEVVSWSSNDEYIAEVDKNGLITAKQEGTSTVTVKLLTGRSADVKVIVTGPTITIDKEEITLPVLSTEQIKVSDLVPNDAVESWYSYDTNIASVDDKGTVTANNAGETTIVLHTLSDIEKYIRVVVTPATITISKTELNLTVLGSEQIKVSDLVPNDAVESWYSNDDYVATVTDDGTVTAKHEGSTSIKIMLLSGLETEVPVYVAPATIKFTPDNITMSIFGSEQIEVSDLVPGDKVVSWQSNDENIATVDETGLVTAKSPGNTDIIIKLLSGIEVRVGVYVEQPYLRLSTDYLNLQVTETETISVRDHVEGDEVVSFTSEDSEVAEVDDKGKVTAKKPGQTDITVAMKSGIAGKVHVDVYHPPITCRIEPSNVINIGDKAKIEVEGLLEGEKVPFTVDDPSVASIDENGNITALSEGTTRIRYTFDYGPVGGPMQILSIRVIDPIIMLSSDFLTLKEGETKRIRVGMTEGDGVSSFESENPGVASVDSKGKVTGVSAGTTKVTVTLRSGLSGDVKVTVEGDTPITQFSDVTDPSAFYYDPVYWAVEKGITTGYSDNTFRPTAECHRAAVVTFLWRLAGKPEPVSMATFTDMTDNSDFDKAISWASQNGITTGYNDNTFRPYSPCNRAAIVTFLWRYAGSPQPSKMATFNDMTGNSDFDKAISWAYENKITTGYDGNLFKPWNTCNRMAVVTFLYRLAN